MPSLNIGQQGKLKSMPKLTRINGDDHLKTIYRNLGNNHAYPFIWAMGVIMPDGATEVVLASGIKWHGYDLATYATVTATPEGALGYLTVEKDTTNNVITIKSSAAASGDTGIAVMCMLGEDMKVEGFNQPDYFGPTESLP
jgi:hypothetical protein